MRARILTLLTLTLLTVVAIAPDASAQGRGRGHGRGNGRDGWSLGNSGLGKKCEKFVNCHDARDGRWDNRGPRRSLTRSRWYRPNTRYRIVSRSRRVNDRFDMRGRRRW